MLFSFLVFCISHFMLALNLFDRCYMNSFINWLTDRNIFCIRSHCSYLASIKNPVSSIFFCKCLHSLKVTSERKLNMWSRTARLCIFKSIFYYLLSCLHWGPPAGCRFCHSDGPDAFPSSHLWNIVLDLSLRAIVTDIRHDNLRVEREPRTSAVTVHSTTQTEPEHPLHYTHRHTKPREKN